MTSLIIVTTYLSGQILRGTLAQQPTKPEENDLYILVDGGSHPLQGAKKITITDPGDSPPGGGLWWDAQVQFVDGLEGMFFIPEDDYVAGDPVVPPGWTELIDEDGHKVWVLEVAVSSATANGPYWRG